jgi:hypothetical protein
MLLGQERPNSEATEGERHGAGDATVDAVAVVVEPFCRGLHPPRLGAFCAMGHGYGIVLGGPYPPQLLTAIGLESRWRVLERFAESGAGDHQAVERHTLRCSGKYPFGFPRLCNELYNTPLFSYLRYAILTFCA